VSGPHRVPDAAADTASRRRPARGLLVLCDRLSLVAIAAGLALELQPFWSEGLRVGFVVTLAAVVAQILFGHLVAAPASE